MAAARAGYITSTANVRVAAPAISRVDFVLTLENSPALETKVAAPVTAASTSALMDELEALKKRIGELEAALKTAPAPVEIAKAAPPGGSRPIGSAGTGSASTHGRAGSGPPSHSGSPAVARVCSGGG